jgi:hypothetical protein
MAEQTLLNGKAFQFSNISFKAAGRSFLGLNSINLKEELTPEGVESNAPYFVAQTDGVYRASGDFEQVFSEWIRLITFLGDGYGQKPINLSATGFHPLLDTFTIVVKNFTLMGGDLPLKAGAAPVTQKCGMFITEPIEVNGLTLVKRRASVEGGIGIAISAVLGL